MEAYPRLEIELGAAELVLGGRASSAGRGSVRGACRAAGGGACLSRSSTPSASPTPTRSASSPPCASSASRSSPGTFTVLAGLSGSGKSTLLRALCGLVPHFHGGHADGELAVAGLRVRDHGPGELAAVCGTVLQDPEAQVVMGGVRAELELPLEHGGASAAAIARGVEETALALGVGHLLDRRTDTLSGGELQRVAIAAAMVRRPPLLLLDEPTSQLDPVAGDELVWLLRRLNEDWGTAVVMAEHRLERCLPAADRVLALVDGARGLRRRRRASSSPGRSSPRPGWRPRPRGSSRSQG